LQFNTVTLVSHFDVDDSARTDTVCWLIGKCALDMLLTVHGLILLHKLVYFEILCFKIKFYNFYNRKFLEVFIMASYVAVMGSIQLWASVFH